MIRPACPQDFPSLATLYRNCFREPPWFEEFTEQEVIAYFEEMLAWSDTIFLVFEDEIDGQIIACAISFNLARKPDVAALVQPNRQTIYMAEMFVRQDKRNNGITKQLICARLRIAAARSFTHLAARTSTDQPIIQRLYLNDLGATIIARQTVVSTKVINGVTTQAPDKRVIMYGEIPTSFRTA